MQSGPEEDVVVTTGGGRAWPLLPDPLAAFAPALGRHGNTIWLAAQLASSLVLLVVWVRVVQTPWHDDTYAFWHAWADGRLYPAAWSPVSEYVYSPAFAQAFHPLTLVPWRVAHALWATLQLLALVWMLGPVGAVAAIAWPVPFLAQSGTAVFGSLNNGNPMILTAAAITLGLTRWPGAFAFVLLTKVSAGIGIVYFAVRREWRKLLIAVGTTAAIVLASLLLGPHLWVSWLELLAGAAFHAGSADAMGKEIFMPVPLAVRGPIGLVIVIIAGLRGKAWLVPLGCFLALPDIHLSGYAVLVAVPAVWLRMRSQRVDAA